MPSVLPTALVVEDDAALREALVWLLREERFQVEGVANAAEAEASIRAQGPRDVLVVDLKLPDLDGDALVQRLQAAGLVKWSGLTVAITASRRPVSEGVATVLRKPFTAPQFLELLRHAGADFRARPLAVVEGYGVFPSAAAKRSMHGLEESERQLFAREMSARLQSAIRAGSQFSAFSALESVDRRRVECTIDHAHQRVLISCLSPGRARATRS